MGLAQGFVGIGVAFLPAEPNLTLARWMFVRAVVFIIAALLIFFGRRGRRRLRNPQRKAEAATSKFRAGRSPFTALSRLARERFQQVGCPMVEP